MNHLHISETADKSGGNYTTTRDGCKLFIYNYEPIEPYQSTLFIISGITGINHHNEKDIIELLSNHENRVVVTETPGPLMGKRVVRGREIESMRYYFL